jgi:23S rRNA (cytidine1920-2'-O)/16S rRNA (cytidine1409-2'-O)-methyltransferase
MKTRLDLAIVQRGLAQTRQRAGSLIMAGKVLVNNRKIDKPGTRVRTKDKIILKGDIPYVSRGGLKLEAGLDAFDIDVSDFVCLDAGASTGGFTDCLLQHGAASVFAVDVGYGQLAWNLRQDPRVVVIERTNIRYMPLTLISAPVDLITIDVSFISLKIVVTACVRFLKKYGKILALIKPQFEVGKGKVGKRGVVRDPMLHNEVIHDLESFFSEINLESHGVITSPLQGRKGNKEFLICLKERTF